MPADLGRIDVPNAGDHTLIQEQLAQSSATLPGARLEVCEIESRREGLRPERAQGGPCHQLSRVGASQTAETAGVDEVESTVVRESDRQVGVRLSSNTLGMHRDATAHPEMDQQGAL